MAIVPQTGQPNRRARHAPGGRNHTMQWRSVIVMLVLSVLTLGLPAPAAAASRSGAIHMSDAHCHDEGNGYITCFTAEGVTTETLTPTGNAIYTGHLRSSATVFDAAGHVVTTSSGMRHYHRLSQDEMLHVLAEHMRTTFTMPDGSICTTTYAVHLANGQLQFEHSATECS